MASNPLPLRTKVSLEKLASGNSDALDLLRRGLETRGWILLELPADIIATAKALISEFNEFFNYSDNNKFTYAMGSMFGYVQSRHKESFRVLTGPNVSDSPGANCFKLPAVSKENVIKLSKRFDEISTAVVKHAAAPVFNTTWEYLGKTRRLPLALDTDKLKQQANTVIGGYGMLDTVRYTMIPRSTGLSIVTEHTDPGLLTFTAGATAPGLQMRDLPTGEWIDIQPEEYVCWAGIEATEITNGRIEGGWHRVVPLKTLAPVVEAPRQMGAKRDNSNERVSLWYEICAESQVLDEIRRKGISAAHSRTSILGYTDQDLEKAKTDIVIEMKKPLSKYPTPAATEPATTGERSTDSPNVIIKTQTGTEIILPGPPSLDSLRMLDMHLALSKVAPTPRPHVPRTHKMEEFTGIPMTDVQPNTK